MHSSNWTFLGITKRYLSLARNKDSLANTVIIIAALIILGIWLAGVIYTTTAHEYWRDEVRALSWVRCADSPLHLFKLIQYDGHPIAWYLLLYLGNLISDSPNILPILSIAISFAAVTIFLFFSPFPFWLKTLFIFSLLPFYEYTVLARNYGISMMLFFIFAALYHKRNEYPLLLALLLFVLANTNVHSAILVWPLAFMWFWDTVAEKKTLSVKRLWIPVYAPLVIISLGFILCLLTTWPRENTIATDIHALNIIDVAQAITNAILFPAWKFNLIVKLPAPINHILVWLAIVGLIPRINLFLAALTSQVVFSVFFQLVYDGKLRHQGLFLIFLITLYWIALQTLRSSDTNKIKKILSNAGLYISLLALIFIGLNEAAICARRDILTEMSSSKALGAFINESDIYREAIIVPEPGYIAESLPYYAGNKMYLPREHRFGKMVSFTTDADANLSLSDLLATGFKIRKAYGKPVLIVLGHLDLDKNTANKKRYSFNKVFSWNATDLYELNNRTKLVRTFKSSYGDENYMVYAID